MDFNAFDLIKSALAEELEKQGFTGPGELEDPAGKAVVYFTDEVAYSLLYDNKRQRFELRSTTLNAPGQPGDWRSLSLWLFDEKEGTKADVESIIGDFLEVVRGPKRVAMVQQKKKRGKDDERSVDPMFFVNRVVNIFPEMRDALNEEKIMYGQVRFVNFTKKNIVPKCDDILKNSPDSETGKKLVSLFDDMYKNGDLDLRSVLTIALINELNDSAFDALGQRAGEDLQKNIKFTRKLKGKNIKPEKKKKEKKVVAKL